VNVDKKMDQGEAMLVQGIEQDEAAADEYYTRMSPQDRGEIALWITGRKGGLEQAPKWVLSAVGFFAGLAFMQTGLRWSKKQEGIADG
jgi:hypothetical protein